MDAAGTVAPGPGVDVFGDEASGAHDAPGGTEPSGGAVEPSATAGTPAGASQADPCAGGEHRPGRPRSAEADRAILSAAIEILADEGYAGLSMEGVASRAGVGKATVYRRWPCKSDLVVHALHRLHTDPEAVPDTGTVRGDLVAFMRQVVDKLRRSQGGRVMPGLLAEFSRNPDLARAFRQEFVEPRRALVVDSLRRGIERGEVRPDVDLDLVVDVTVAVFQHRLLVTGRAIDDDLPERVADLLLEGIGAVRKGSRR
ncbi:MAG: TetR/AcrR family transcriptional regulator [Acidimicrobiales bacterium]